MPGAARAVGWNWQSSKSATSAPAAWAITVPAPIAPQGFVVLAQRAAAPPVARIVAGGGDLAGVGDDAVAALAVHQRATAEAPSATSILDSAAARAASLSVIRRPVPAPPAWTTRRRECPPSSASERLPSGSRSNSTPRRLELGDDRGRLAGELLGGRAPAGVAPRGERVVDVCSSGESSGPIAAARPPWAQKLELSGSGLREIIVTSAPASAAVSAA